MSEFTTIVEKTKQGIFYLNIPNPILKQMNLKPFMAGTMKAEKNGIKIFDFQKTKKIKIDISKKTLVMLKRIMRLEGFGSLDETISNIIHKFLGKEKTTTVYLYPLEFLHGKYWLIDDYEKHIKKSKKKQNSKFFKYY